MTNRETLRFRLLVGLLWIAGGLGCTARPAATPEAGPPKSNAKTTELGPLRVTVEVAPQPLPLSDEAKLTLTMEYEAGVEVEKPAFGEELGDFVVRDFRELLPEVKDGRTIARQIYTLEPTHTGQLPIAPLPLTFTDNRPNGDRKQHTVETEGLTLEVTSLIGTEAPSLDDLQGLTGPLELPAPAGIAWWWLAVGALGCGALAIVLWRIWRKPAAVAEKPLSPQELAYLELQKLLEQELSVRDVKLFYVELTGIVRRYIERTTGIHAAEQTTEEFLREVRAGQAFSATERGRLAAFLESADLVKFAAHEPTAADIEDTFRRAQVFLGLAAPDAAAENREQR